MQYYRCKCGRKEAWGSMSPPLCSRCPDCGTNLATAPDIHGEPQDHDFSLVEKVETDQGDATITRCRYCHRTRREIERSVRPPDTFSVMVDGRDFEFHWDAHKGHVGGWLRDDYAVLVQQDGEMFCVSIDDGTVGWTFAGERFKSYLDAAIEGHRQLSLLSQEPAIRSRGETDGR